VSLQILVNIYIRETFSAVNLLALVRFLSSVCSNMNGQGTFLDEVLSASRNRACVRSLIRVDSIMSLQNTLAVEALCQLSARDWDSEGEDDIPLCMIANRIGMDERLAVSQLTL
jgi:hypothetical protein